MKNISETRDKLYILPTLKSKAEKLKNNLASEKNKTSSLLEKYEKESRDVQKIKEESFSSYVYKLFGKYDNKVEKERKEELEAKIDYDNSVLYTVSLENEIHEIKERIKELDLLAYEYKTELEERRVYLKNNLSEPDGQRLEEIEKERESIISQRTETEEAFKAASQTIAIAEKAYESLEGAESWASYDMWTKGGLITHSVKYSHIDEAEEYIQKLSSQIKLLKQELSDVNGLPALNFNEISSSQRTLDFWFDNIFTDMSVRDSIQENMEELDKFISSIQELKDILKEKIKMLDGELKQNTLKEEELLISLDNIK